MGKRKGPQTIDARDRRQQCQCYVDLILLRDVIERHRVTNDEALRQLQCHLFANPAGTFPAPKSHRDLRSRALPVAEETLHQLLKHLQGAFVVLLVAIHTASERQRMRNPRKVYPVGPGLIHVFHRAGRENRGPSLETAVLVELERRGYDVGWVRVAGDLEVDYLAEHPVNDALVVQVARDSRASPVRERTWTPRRTPLPDVTLTYHR